MQRLGYVYCNEDLGVFGIHRAHGPAVDKRLSSLFMWTECITNFDAPAIESSGFDPDDVFFKGLAYRLMWCVHWNIALDALCFRYEGVRGDYDLPNEWHLALLKAFNEVSDLMTQREILADESGVSYRYGNTQTLWAFTDITMPLSANLRVRDVLNNEVFETPKLDVLKHHVYVIDLP
jgi:hypothetical protein